MSESDPINAVAAIHAFIAAKKKTISTINEISCPTSIDELKKSLNFKYDEEAETVFLLKEDVFVELGPPQYESVAYVAITRTPTEVRDGLITLIGPDIPKSEGKSMNFGQVLLFGGRNITALEYKELEREIFHLKNLEGFMIRALPNKLWCRVSKGVGRRGFSFETLGKALMISYKEKFPSIETMEILFVTTDAPRDFLELKVLGTEIRKEYIAQYSTHLKSRLADLTEKQRADCTNPWDCDECDYTEVCDEVRDIIDKMKAYHKKIDNL
ncbi:MAG: hypothetical protein HWN65_02870 [Candidatus Helarchaeota archaeon]|nr:hypothetical protein [Candidatus Helarchaeota archaeon]